MADVQIRSVVKSFGSTQILKGIDLDIQDGEFVVFVGPSGCGKSTLLRSIAGLEEVNGGELRIGGRVVNDVPPAERGIAMVFQSYALYPHMNLFDNMAFGLKLADVPKAEIEEAVHHAARILHIDHLLDRKPKELSGGQRQRVAIGRAIVRKPQVFLFDEPLSNLDAALRVQMRYEFAKLHQDLKTTMIYVTHDQVEAMTLADRIVVLSAGRIEQVGSPLELYEHPANLFVAGFIGSPKMNFLDAELVEISEGVAQVKLTNGTRLTAHVDASRSAPGARVKLGIRPEHLELDQPENALGAAVSFVESLGGETVAYCEIDGTDTTLTCSFDGRTRLRAGQPLSLSLPAACCHLFDEAGLAYPRQAPTSH